MVIQREAFYFCHLTELNADHAARMSPVRFDRYRVGQRIHRIEDHEIGVAKKLDEAYRPRRVFELMLGIRGIDDAAAIALEAITVRVAAVSLQLGGDPIAGDVVSTV